MSITIIIITILTGIMENTTITVIIDTDSGIIIRQSWEALPLESNAGGIEELTKANLTRERSWRR